MIAACLASSRFLSLICWQQDHDGDAWAGTAGACRRSCSRGARRRRRESGHLLASAPHGACCRAVRVQCGQARVRVLRWTCLLLDYHQLVCSWWNTTPDSCESKSSTTAAPSLRIYRHARCFRSSKVASTRIVLLLRGSRQVNPRHVQLRIVVLGKKKSLTRHTAAGTRGNVLHL